MYFVDRSDAGKQLATKLGDYRDQRPVVLALPRGGVPVGFEIARELDAPLDVVLVRKLGSPISPELAIGAIVDGNPVQRFINRDIVADLDVPDSYIEAEIARQTGEIERRRERYAHGRRRAEVQGRTAIVVDDGIATGSTMRVALRAVRRRDPARLAMATPVAPAETIATMRDEVDDIVCLYTPRDFGAIGFFYRDFTQVDDDTVVDLLALAARNFGRSDQRGPG